MKKIIVPTDFSEAAWNAMEYAINLATLTGAEELLVLHSFQEPSGGAGKFVSLEKVFRKGAEDELKNCVNKIKNAHPNTAFAIQKEAYHGSLLDALKSHVKDYNDQVIVMGTHGETNAIEKLMGSNASTIVSKVYCPVLVIPPLAKFSFDSRIVFGADFNNIEKTLNIQFLQNLCKRHPSNELKVVHVYHINEGNPIDDLEIKTFLHQIQFQLHNIESKDIATGLNQYVSVKKTDLLVLVKKKKGLFENLFQESITQKLSANSKIPLLILKAKQ